MSIEYESESSKRRTYTILAGIIILTLPCYCAGFVALALAPRPGRPTPTSQEATLTSPPLLPTVTETLAGPPTGTAVTFTPGPPTATLQSTPTQFIPPSRTPTATFTDTPTNTPPLTPTFTLAPTLTATDTRTPDPGPPAPAPPRRRPRPSPTRPLPRRRPVQPLQRRRARRPRRSRPEETAYGCRSPFAGADHRPRGFWIRDTGARSYPRCLGARKNRSPNS